MTKEKLFENILKACEEEYKDKIGIFNQLDTKAQQVTAFSGILLGFIVSFCQKDNLDLISNINIWCMVLFIIVIISLLLSISLSIYSMRTIKIIGMPTFSEIKMVYDDLCELTDNEYGEENYNIFLREKISSWESTFDSLSYANRKKAKYVFLSQFFCGFGLILLGFITIIILQSYFTICKR